MSKVLVERRGRVLWVTLNRPEARNAIDQDVHHLLVEAWREFGRSADLDVAVITGNGGAFCAGMDLKTFVPEYVGADQQKVLDLVPVGLGGITRGMHWLRKPIIAAVNGWAIAAGFELALAADIRIASERAVFGSFEARRGFHHGDGGIPRLVNICGVGFAMEMVLTAEPVDAERALRAGLVSRVVPHEALMDQALAVAEHILRNDQEAVRSAKATVLEMIGRGLDDQLRIEAINGYSRMALGNEVRRRLQQFYEKSDPGRVGRRAATGA
ncbi:MAG: enoyl-CoA hydratase/isomerase family protein [Pseudomonadota bacterium]